MSSSGHTQTGQPGPGMSSICRGKAPRKPAWLMERSWPPHTFITRTRSGSGRPRMRSSQPRASVTRLSCSECAVPRRPPGSAGSDAAPGAARGQRGAQPVEPGLQAVRPPHRDASAPPPDWPVRARAARPCPDRSRRSSSRKSALLSSTRSAARNITGYLAGLSSPSVTDNRVTLTWWPRSKLAGQTRLPTFSMNSRSTPSRSMAVQCIVHHVRIQVAGLAGGDLHRRHATGADALGVVFGLEVALDHGDGKIRRPAPRWWLRAGWSCRSPARTSG